MPGFIYEVKGHLVHVTTNRPEHLNCFSEEMAQLWTTALEDIRDRGDIYVVFLSGNGKTFCAGGDVRAMATGEGFFESNDDITSTALTRKSVLWRGIQRISLILEEIGKPIITRIHSFAVGVGLDMALMCGIRVASEGASFSESYFSVEITPGDDDTYFLPHLVGWDKALDLFSAARVLKGAEAERIGFAIHIVPDDRLDDYVEQYIQRLMDAPQQTIRLTKHAIDQSEQSTLRSSLDLVSSFVGIMTEPDGYRTRTTALVECLSQRSSKK